MPGMICAVFNCKNSFKSAKAQGLSLIFHVFPKKDSVSSTVREEWIRRCDRGASWNPDNSRVCSAHFSEMDYERDIQNELLGLPLRKKLKKTAFPNLNLPSSNTVYAKKPRTAQNVKGKEKMNFEYNSQLSLSNCLRNDATAASVLDYSSQTTPTNNQKRKYNVNKINKHEASIGASTFTGSRRVIREALLRKNIPESAVSILMESLSKDTLKQYESTYKIWWKFCIKKGWNMFEANEQQVSLFLEEHFKQKSASYSSLNTIRSALSLILQVDIGNSTIIKRFLRNKPPQKRCNFSWDPQKVLSRLGMQPSNDLLSIEKLSMKVATLLALITGHRIQTLARIKVENIIVSLDQILILVPDQLKSASAREPPYLKIPFFKEKPALCAATALMVYIERTAAFRSEAQELLFLTTRLPYKTATTSTITRWIKQTLSEAGINTISFSAYSSRFVATSAANRNAITLETIRRTASWTQKSEVFTRFYNRALKDQDSFAKAVLT